MSVHSIIRAVRREILYIMYCSHGKVCEFDWSITHHVMCLKYARTWLRGTWAMYPTGSITMIVPAIANFYHLAHTVQYSHVHIFTWHILYISLQQMWKYVLFCFNFKQLNVKICSTKCTVSLKNVLWWKLAMQLQSTSIILIQITQSFKCTLWHQFCKPASILL